MLTLISAALVCSAQGITNNNIYPAPPAPTLPAALNTLVDPIFGTTLMRLTDANDGERCTNSYSYWPSINLNSTRVIAKCVHRTPEGYLAWDARFYRLDPRTFTVTDKEVAGVDSPLVRSPIGEYIIVEDAIWSGTDPDILFAHTATRLYSINVGTYAWTLLAELSTSVNSNMLFQMTKSVDDNVFAFTVKGLTGANVNFLVWDRRPNNLLLSVTGEHDEVHVDKSGQYLTVIQSGNRVYDLRTGAATDLTDGPPDFGMGHADFGMGIAVAVERWTPGITVRNLSTPHQFAWIWTPKLQNGTSDWSQSLHIALNTNDAWALISTFTASTLESSGILKDEIWLLATNGSGAKFRMAHHHSVYQGYYDAPRADTSQDGKYVTFTSNWGNSAKTGLAVAVSTLAILEASVGPTREPGCTKELAGVLVRTVIQPDPAVLFRRTKLPVKTPPACRQMVSPKRALSRADCKALPVVKKTVQLYEEAGSVVSTDALGNSGAPVTMFIVLGSASGRKQVRKWRTFITEKSWAHGARSRRPDQHVSVNNHIGECSALLIEKM